MKIIKNLSKALLLLLFGSSGLQLNAQTNEGDDKTLSPYFYVPGKEGGAEELPLLRTTADVSIAGVIADVKVTQVYKNNGRVPIEAIYVFPGSTRAAVYDMQMKIGKRHIKAKVEEVQKARSMYEEARTQGKTASLLEQKRPNVFQMNVANIMPGDSIHVELFYTELLIPEDGIYEFVYPTVVGPRYSNTLLADANPKEMWVANPYTTEGTNLFYDFHLTAHVNAGMPLHELSSPSHKVNINFENASSAEITLKPGEEKSGNKDFVLRYRLSGNKIQTGMLLYPGEKENYFLMMMQPPKVHNKTEVTKREYIFIVDISGSMWGFPLEVSKELLKNLIGGLNPTDKFNVMLFAGNASMLSPQSVAATKENIDHAISLLSKQQGGGSTELVPALKKALSIPKDENYSRSFVIATDGYVTVEKEAFELIRNNLGNANFFAFGIGSAVNRHLIEGIAFCGLGEPAIILNESEAKKAAKKFKDYIENPLLTSIKVNFKGLDVFDVEPASVADVFADRPVLVYGKYRGNPLTASVEMKGINADGVYKQQLNLSQFQPSSENHALKYLWARNKIKTYDYYGKIGNQMQEEITKIGLTYNLLTDYTSFIAIDDEVRNKDGKIVSVKQPLPLPEGVSNYAVGGSYNYGTVSSLPSGNYKRHKSGESYYPSSGTGKYQVACDAVKEECEKDDKKIKPKEKKPATTSAIYNGGERALLAFLKKNLKYPVGQKQKGKVKLSFDVSPEGLLSNIKIERSLGKLFDDEAIRVVKLMPAWVPAYAGGTAVNSRASIEIDFQP